MSYFKIEKKIQAVNQNDGKTLATNQIQLSTLSIPTQSDLAVGAIYCDGSTIYGYNGSSWVDMMTSSTINIAAWETLYAADQTLNMASTGLTFAGTHATNNTFTLNASGSGDCLAITNTGSGYDISGTSDEWSIKSSSNVGVLELGSTGTLNVGGGALTIGKTATATTLAGTLTVDEASTLTGAVTATASITITGSAATDVLTITDGDIAVTEGSITATDADNAATVSITNDGATSIGNGADNGVVEFICDTLTSGTLLHLSVTEGTLANGHYLKCWDETADAAVFAIGEDGATVITGNAEGTDAITITDGDITVSDGDVTLDGGYVKISEDATDKTALDIDTAGISVAAVTLNADALTGTEAALDISVDVLVDGVGLKIENTGEALTSGELFQIKNTEGAGNIATITGNLCSITSDIEENAGTLTADYDMMLFSRADTQAHASQYDAQGSVVKILKTLDKAAGTIVDAVIGLEIESAVANTALPLGATVQITEVGVGATALNIVAAGVGADDVLITSSGAHTNGLAGAHITTTGDLATGGANLILTVSGSSCDAAARAFEISAAKDVYAMYVDTATATNDAVYIAHTGNLAAGKAVMHVTDGGIPAADNVYVGHFAFAGTATAESVVLFADGGGKDVTGLLVDCDARYAADNLSAHLTLYGDEAGNYPILAQFYHEDAGAASGEYCAKLNFFGSDDAPAKELYASIEVEMDDTSAANPDGILWIKGDLAGTNTASAGFTGNKILMGAAASTLTTAGTWDLTLSTNDGTNSGTIVITDAADQNITITPNGIGHTLILGSAFPTTAVTAAHTLTVAECGWITCTSAAPYALTLPAVAGCDGIWYTIKKTDAAANAITITGNGAETIDGSNTNATIDAQYDTISIYCDGSAWFIFSEDLA